MLAAIIVSVIKGNVLVGLSSLYGRSIFYLPYLKATSGVSFIARHIAYPKFQGVFSRRQGIFNSVEERILRADRTGI